MPSWAVELALTIERPFTSPGRPDAPRALLLVRSAGAWQPMACALGAAMREVDSVAGVRAPLPRLSLMRSRPEPGLHPLPRRLVQAHLHGASHRGQAVGYRRRRAEEAAAAAWRCGPGAVLTCSGRVGVSAQAVVAISGRGALSPLRPPPGGATVLRAWRCRRPWRPRGPLGDPDAEWALAAGVVLASSSGMGLGRLARSYAVLTRIAGWNATVLTGATALELARAGDPRYPPPTTIARRTSREEVEELLTTCLTAAADPTRFPALPRA